MGNAAVQTLSNSTDAFDPELPWKLVTHQYPDTDAWACLWAAHRFIVPRDAESTIVFHQAGFRLPHADAEGYNVLYMDTGGGDFDQHGKELKRASSFMLLVEQHGLNHDPGICDILELTRATDNVEAVSRTSVHYYFKGLPFFLRNPESKEVDWSAATDRVFEVLDVLYSQGRQRAEAKERLKQFGRMHRLPNKIWFGTVWWNPNLREASFDAGADVVMWTQKKGKQFYVGIQRSRRSKVSLAPVMAALLMAEATARGTSIAPMNEARPGSHSAIPGWYLHDSFGLIVCGSRSHELDAGDCTMLTAHEITTIIKDALSTLPRQH